MAGRLRVGKAVVAPLLVLVASSYSLWQAALQQQQAPLTSSTTTFFDVAKLVLPLLGMLLSFSYLIGFFSVPLTQGDEPSTKTQATTSFSSSSSTTPSSSADILFNSGGMMGGERMLPRQAVSAGETVIVVGAGTAGAAAAVGLAERGFKVLLFERDMSLQDRIVGELLQPGGVRALERMGLDDCAKEGIDSVGVDGYVVFTPNKKGGGGMKNEKEEEEEEEVKDILLKYPAYDPATLQELFGVISSSSSFSSSSSSFSSLPPPTSPPKPITTDDHKQQPTAAGSSPTHSTSSSSSSSSTHPPTGRSFHNGRFVQRLRERALAQPNVTVIEGIVTKLLYSPTSSSSSSTPPRVIGVEYKVETGRMIKEEEGGEEVKEKVVKTALAPLTIIADGLWSSLRTAVDKQAKPTQLSSFVGLIITHPPMASPLPHPHCGHVVLAEPSPVLLYQISSTETRVLVDIHGKLPSASTGELSTHLLTHTLPQLPTVLQEPFAAAVASGHIKSMPNRAMPSANMDGKEGVLLLGDALNMRHPLTGGGMTVALRDVEAICCLLEETPLSNPLAFKRLKARFTQERKAWAATINVLANALHAVFSTPGGDETRKDLRDACFDYLSIGGYCSGGPINLLSGLTPKPSILALHFFLVAFHGVGKYLYPFPTPGRMIRMYHMLHVACCIIMPLLCVEGSTILASWPVRTFISLIFPYGGGI